jgi:hypothetical protein
VTPGRTGLIEPEIVRLLPILTLEKGTVQEMVLEALDMVKDLDELVAPRYVESPSQLALTLHAPKTNGV